MTESKELADAKGQIAKQEKQIADLEHRLKQGSDKTPVEEAQSKRDLKAAQDELALLQKTKQAEIEVLKRQLEEAKKAGAPPAAVQSAGPVATASSARAILSGMGAPLVTPAPAKAPAVKQPGAPPPATPTSKQPGGPAAPPPATPPVAAPASGSESSTKAGEISPRGAKKVIVKSKMVKVGGADGTGGVGPNGAPPPGPGGAVKTGAVKLPKAVAPIKK